MLKAKNDTTHLELHGHGSSKYYLHNPLVYYGFKL